MSDSLADIDLNIPDISHKYDSFLHTNGVPYVFLEAPISILDEKIPEGANWSAKEDGQKTVGEYSILKKVSLDGSKVVIALCAMEAPTYRKPAITYDDVQDWETWLNTKGYTIENFLTIAERNTLLESAAYLAE